MKVVIAILNYNGVNWLQKFLSDVIKHSPEGEVVVIDNASTDDSVDYLKKNFPSTRIIENESNSGFAGGYNEGLKHIDADVFVLLNSDIEVTENWLSPVLSLLSSDDQIAAAQPKILAYNHQEKFEHAGACGGYIDQLGYPFCRGRIFTETEEDKGQYDSPEKIFWATGACMFIKAKKYWEAGGLDEHFFAHMEEIDLCWRLQNMGYDIVACPASSVYHVGGGTLDYRNPRKTYLNFRNSLFAIHKNWGDGLFYAIFARLILDGIAGFKFLLGGDLQHIWSIIKAHFDYYGHLNVLRKQRAELKSRNKSLKELNGVLKSSIVYQFYVKKIKKFNELKF
ncbi:MAG: glycosyltransferase family 2 protein [Flavobacteriales bacterium]|nr:glycosyltransferase family 2 protein [Flavobacteriales bacterium]MCB9196699.1 glycosyltransferase family 2 protein [Flavobacteriales bacterium]